MSKSMTDETKNLADLLREVTEGEETVFDVVKEVGENGESITRVTVGNRELQPEQPDEPEISRARARSHVFNELGAFAEYLTRNTSKDNAIVLADIDSRAFTAVLNESLEGDREEIYMEAVAHPLFQPWSSLFDRAIPVVEFALFALKHRRAVVDPDGHELAMTMSQVKANKSITKQVGVGKKSINGCVVELEIAGEKQGVPVEIPETITILCPIFVGSEPQEIEIDLLVTELRDDIVVYMTAADVENKRIQAFEVMVADLRSQTDLLIGMGKVKHRDWSVIEAG